MKTAIMNEFVYIKTSLVRVARKIFDQLLFVDHTFFTIEPKQSDALLSLHLIYKTL